ncbi:RsmD family RNA methyltransferase [Streptomyces nogalater]
MGLEALSRGAATPCWSRPTPAPPGSSARTCGTWACPAPRCGRAKRNRSSAARPAEPYDLVFLDPPYAVTDHDLREILLTLHSEGWLAEQALVTVERSTRGGEFHWPDGFEALRSRRYGEGTFWYGRAASTCEDAR